MVVVVVVGSGSGSSSSSSSNSGAPTGGLEVSGIFALVCTVGGWVGGHDDVLLQIFIVMDARCSSSWCCLHGENAKLQKLLCECCDF